MKQSGVSKLGLLIGGGCLASGLVMLLQDAPAVLIQSIGKHGQYSAITPLDRPELIFVGVFMIVVGLVIGALSLLKLKS